MLVLSAGVVLHVGPSISWRGRQYEANGDGLEATVHMQQGKSSYILNMVLSKVQKNFIKHQVAAAD